MSSSRRAEALLAIAGLLLSLAFAEMALRMLGLATPRPTGYAPVNTSRPSRVGSNEKGYRDASRSIPKAPGVRRVLSLGDSFAWGHGIEMEDAYPRRIERRLSRERPDERFEVVNLALPGMNTVDQELQLRTEGFTYEPESVLLGYGLNDSEDKDAAEARRAREWQAQPAPGPLDASALVRFVKGRLFATLENRRREQGFLSMYQPDATGWRAGREALLAMGEECRKRGTPFVVAIWPLLGNPLDERYPFQRIHQVVAEAAGAAGAQVVDLLSVFRGLRSDLLVVDGADDEHPNEVAHRIAANALFHAVAQTLPVRSPKAEALLGSPGAPAATGSRPPASGATVSGLPTALR